MNLNSEHGLDSLAFALEQAQEAERIAKNKKEDLDRKLIAVLGVKEEGPQTFEGDFYQATTIGKVERKIDRDELTTAYPYLSVAARDCIDVRPTVNAVALSKLKESEPEEYEKLNALITTSLGRPAVHVARLEGANHQSNVVSIGR